MEHKGHALGGYRILAGQHRQSLISAELAEPCIRGPIVNGRSKAFDAIEAIEEFLDREDYFLAKDALEEFRNSDDSSVILHEDVDWGTLGR